MIKLVAVVIVAPFLFMVLRLFAMLGVGMLLAGVPLIEAETGKEVADWLSSLIGLGLSGCLLWHVWKM
ncbi:hypothetical protein [Posidoniimonas corsicana]|uniref:hypothetical protein n=1 Tax=Posidoniimonas corsicana TaxID=1938618 RepID=UPI0011B6FECA|nr:hypothetical protein [Posidoniimonas corsicana]